MKPYRAARREARRNLVGKPHYPRSPPPPHANPCPQALAIARSAAPASTALICWFAQAAGLRIPLEQAARVHPGLLGQGRRLGLAQRGEGAQGRVQVARRARQATRQVPGV
ncbi:hypothetical protein, partial [Achromobacter xylosoxidans]|uniref:hypothetical protein n=1 Tax=Alcaligenes xylosoxydans xylosoxydans TaxID=85698 RepID=UPI001E51F01C